MVSRPAETSFPGRDTCPAGAAPGSGGCETWVRSRMRSRSNSARAAKTWKISVVVSMLSWSERNPTCPWWRRRECRHQMAKGSAEPVSTRPRACRPGELVEDLVECGACRQCPAGRVDEHPVTARRSQGVDLKVRVLVRRRHPGVAEQAGSHARYQNRSRGPAVGPQCQTRGVGFYEPLMPLTRVWVGRVREVQVPALVAAVGLVGRAAGEGRDPRPGA
jgi:hypothetical protein